MHEFSIAKNIVEIVENEVRKTDASQVEQIELDIGRLSGIEIDSLEFIWEVAVQQSVLQSASKVINHIPGKALCAKCGIEFEIDQLFDPCPRCHQYFNDVTQGKELKIKSLTLI